ncbi:MAG: tripartite tricarboxylate transporter substrate binding protein [Betaproteobacteria bacterium]|nr:tripartite tricarboxylate transporter substrate binding protein [Betaproteobacteria bacterium]
MSGKLGALGLLALGLCCTSGAAAQTYPSKPIRILVGFSPGGAVDISARVVAQKLAQTIGQPVIVDNRPGASGNIAADLTAKAPPDGHALLVANVTIAMPSLFAKLAYDVTRDLTPVSLIAVGPSVLVVHPSVPVRNVKELIALARAKPKAFLYGSGGVGNITHLEMELLASMTKADMVHVPYKGGGPAAVALLSGEVGMIFGEPASMIAYLKAGKLRAIAVTSAKRALSLPELPTVAEAGVPGFDVTSWNGILTPAGTPREIIARLNAELNRIIAAPAMRERLISLGYEPVGGPPEKFGALITSELAKWAPVVKAANIRVD